MSFSVIVNGHLPEQDGIGYFEEANGGTLVLDEIGDMPLDAQVGSIQRMVGNSSER